MANLTYTRIFADELGKSHIEELCIGLDRADSAPFSPSCPGVSPGGMTEL